MLEILFMANVNSVYCNFVLLSIFKNVFKSNLSEGDKYLYEYYKKIFCNKDEIDRVTS